MKYYKLEPDNGLSKEEMGFYNLDMDFLTRDCKQRHGVWEHGLEHFKLLLELWNIYLHVYDEDRAFFKSDFDFNIMNLENC